MPLVKKLFDKTELVPTKSYPPYAHFPFENFNPVQSAIFDVFNKDCNVVIAARTSAGKTVAAEMFMANEVRERGGKAMFLAPLKALAKEKIDDWTDPKHHFNGLKLSICTGDYRLTAERKSEIEKSNVIIMTSEMLNSRCRNYKSENNDWLKEIGTIVVDESHLLTVPWRGDHLEVGLMKLSRIAPNLRIVFLSATMPNVGEIADWISYQLTSKETYLLESNYRPCPLDIHYLSYVPQGRDYEATEAEKAAEAMAIIDKHEDRFLVFVHTKRTGEMMKKQLISAGYDCEFHNADLDKEKRQEVEKRFRTGNLRVIIATSTLAWGLNLPARRVIILGVHRGMSEVETYDIWQMAGRAGRPGYDPRGDVYILLPENNMPKHVERLEKHQDIQSRLLDHVGDLDKAKYKTLAFHLVSEIHHGQIKTIEDVHTWYEKSLAKFQAHDLNASIVDSTINSLIKSGVIVSENGIYSTTPVGDISSMFYYSPFDVSDLKKNFGILFSSKREDNDLLLSLCLANTDSLRGGIVSKAEKEDIMGYSRKIGALLGDNQITDPVLKGGFAYWCLINGVDPGNVNNAARTLQWDFQRLSQVLYALDGMAGKWDKANFFKELELRVMYGVGRELVQLCKIPNIGKVRAEKLWAVGIKTFADVALRRDLVGRTLGFSPDKAKEICDAASTLELLS